MATVFVTGASGFIGGVFCTAAHREGWDVVGLSRRNPGPAGPAIRWVIADLSDPAGYGEALAGADLVVHLAAAVGRASRDEFMRINVEATGKLLDTCREAGVGRFLFVSSIAARFRDTTHYHYAISKQRAEAAVLASGLATLIVRPTIVLGRGSPIGQRLRTLGTAPIVPVFGNGRARVQPVHVDDVAAVLVHLVRGNPFAGATLELGGPEVVSIEELLRQIHRAARGREPRVLHLPVGPIRSVLGALERVSTVLAPISAGQLASFCNDGVASTDPHSIADGHEFVTLPAMIREMLAND